VTLRRLTPDIRRSDLGYLRLWRDDLAEIIDLVRQLKGAEIGLEAGVPKWDGERHSLVAYGLGDLDELVGLGKRLSYFSITATRAAPADTTPHQLLKVQCAREGCWIEATNPDAEVRGVIGDLKSFAMAHPLIPSCYPPSLFSNVDYSFSGRVAVTFSIPIVVLIGGGIILAIFSSFWKHAPSAVTGLLAILTIGLPVMLVLAGAPFLIRPTTILQTATRAEAPTFLQRRGGDIVIGFVIAAVFYVIGAVTSH
jgi:hypothetical protein